MRLTLTAVQEQAQASGFNVEKTNKGYAVNGQTFRILAEVVNYLNTCLETPVTPDLTVNEVQQVAQQMGFLVQPMAEGYGIFFEGQLLGVAKVLREVMQVLPEYKEAIARYHAEKEEVIAELEEELVDDYLFYNDNDIQGKVELLRVNDAYFIGNYLLRCNVIGGDYAATWDVSENSVPIGEIRMGWNCFWEHSQSFIKFATPQETVTDLRQCCKNTQEEVRPTRRTLALVSSIVGGVLILSSFFPAYGQSARAGCEPHRGSDRRENCQTVIQKQQI